MHQLVSLYPESCCNTDLEFKKQWEIYAIFMPWDSQILCLNTSNFFQKTTHHYPSISSWTISQKKTLMSKKNKKANYYYDQSSSSTSTSPFTTNQPTNQPTFTTPRILCPCLLVFLSLRGCLLLWPVRMWHWVRQWKRTPWHCWMVGISRGKFARKPWNNSWYIPEN